MQQDNGCKSFNFTAMTNHLTCTWSENLLQQTRQAIEEMPLTPGGNLHFKHPTLGYAYTTLDDLSHGRLLLRSKTGSDDHQFAEVEALLQAGWAID